MIFEARFYRTGWAFRLGLLQLRWNEQENYRGLSLEWIKASDFSAGGLSWREFRLARRQQKVAAETARAEAEARAKKTAEV